MAGSRTRSKGKAAGVLARRKQALERAALRMAEQRRAAEEAERERQSREARFDELVADYELAVEDEKEVAAEVEEEVRRVRERGRGRIDKARVVAARVVLEMGEEETVAGCARRLGVGVERVKELRRLGRAERAEDEEGAGSSAPGASVEPVEELREAGAGGEAPVGAEAGPVSGVVPGLPVAGSFEWAEDRGAGWPSSSG
ncbi:hypothetical protein [Streptomyces sp. NBC_00470]|uniref:hypothetical protein n=1 Tax=Streptomyces sp. NBC_00470 TaxID=2975753 RepID=UPI0030E379CE